MMEEYVGHLEGLDPQPVVPGLLILLDIPPDLQGGQQTENVVFMEPELLAELGHSQLFLVIVKRLEYV